MTRKHFNSLIYFADISTLYILVLFILDRDGFRRNFNSQDRLEYAFLGIKIAHQGIPAGRKSAKMYKVECRSLRGIFSRLKFNNRVYHNRATGCSISYLKSRTRL